MHVLDESHILIFLVQMLLILGLARGLGLLLQRYGQASITAEIFVGVLLGPTILGRLLPGVQDAIFPPDPLQQNMLDTVAWLGILFFLLNTGLETDFSSAWRQRREATILSLSDTVIPIAVAFVPCLLLPDRYLANPDQRLIFAIFVSTIMTISALPVTARVLQDLDIYKTDVGFLIICALTINDVAGWLIFALILGVVTRGGFEISQVSLILLGTVVFTTLALTVGKTLADRVLTGIRALGLPDPGASLTFIALLGILFGAITMSVGIHALFGFFIAGIIAGDSKALSESTRQILSQIVQAILVPLFFATIALRIDFLARLDIFLVLFVLVIGVAGRFLGAWVGVWLAGQPRTNWHLISAAHTPGGEMQIVIGILALEFAVITQTVFVAIVLSAIASSMVLGPWMRYALGRARHGAVLRFFSRRAVIPRLVSTNRDDCIRELCHVAAAHKGVGDFTTITQAVLDRENAMGTGLADGVAVPHARLASAQRALVVVGRSEHGIDWNSPDAKPATLIFLILTPLGRDDIQIRVLRAIAEAMTDPSRRAPVADADDEAQLWAAIRNAFAREPMDAAA